MLAEWRVPQTFPSLGRGEIHLWQVALDHPSNQRTGSRCLADDELDTARRFRRPVDRDRWVAAHVCLRHLLGAYLGMKPEDIDFQIGEHDKPALANVGGRSIEFNMSHSSGIALLAFSPDWAIGIDVEELRHDVDVLAVAELTLQACAIAELRSTPLQDRLARFTTLWVRHEASVKCSGAGIASGVGIDTTHAIGDIAVGPGFAAAVATRGDLDHVSLWTARPPELPLR